MPKGFFFWLFTGLAAVVIPLLHHPAGFMADLVLIGLYFAINLQWALVVGTAGLFSFATTAVVGIGSYTAAWFAIKHDLTFWPLYPVLGAIAGGIAGLIIALPAVRLRGVYFALLTIGLVELLRSYVQQDRDNFGGAQGLVGIEGIIPDLQEGTIEGYTKAYAGVLVAVVISLIVYAWVQHGKLGLRLRTARESEPVAGSLGIDIARARLWVFVITSAVLGAVGGYKAAYDGSAVSAAFSFSTLLLLFAMIVVGGINSPRGILLGTILLYQIDDLLLSHGAKRLILLGVLMLVVTLFTTDGLAGLPRQIRNWINAGGGGGSSSSGSSDGDVPEPDAAEPPPGAATQPA